MSNVPRGTFQKKIFSIKSLNIIKSDQPHITVKDFLVSGEEFKLVQNHHHDYLETHPRPALDQLERYYESNAYISHTDSKKGLMSFLYQVVKKYSLRQKVKLIQKQLGSIGSLLDIGAGTGEFLKVASTKDWEVTGVEVSEKARMIALEKGVSLLDDLEKLEENKYDVITLWHVLEHLPNLDSQINKIESLLNPGGCLIVAVPNFNSLDAKHYCEFWAAYDVPRHLWHFSRKSMSSIFSSNMDLVKTKPMIFDAFYVSLLSEKYKSGRAFSIKGLWLGLRSNLAGTKTKEYSSLIYCYRKQD